MRVRELPSQESGAALLELAFSLPIFLLLILGAAEIANLAWASVQLNNAARAGAQYASLSHANAAASNVSNIQIAAQNDAPGLTITFPSAPTVVCSCVTPSTGNQTTDACSTIQTSCTSPSIIVDSIQVTTQAVVKPLIHYTGLPASYTLQAQATMGILP